MNELHMMLEAQRECDRLMRRLKLYEPEFDAGRGPIGPMIDKHDARKAETIARMKAADERR